MDNIFNIDKVFSIDNPHIVSIVKATLLLVLSISGNFLAETLSCQSQKWLENMFVKHALILFMIYFTIDFTQEDAVKDSPLRNAGKAFIVWILFLIMLSRSWKNIAFRNIFPVGLSNTNRQP